jgi:hypothetical protein
LLTAELIPRQKTLPWRTKHGTAFVLAETQNGHAIDTEHERSQGGLDAGQVAGGVYDACLQGGSVGDFEQRIDVVEIDLPEPEDLDLFRVQGEDIDGCLTRAKQEMGVILIQFIPGVLEHSLTHIIWRGIACYHRWDFETIPRLSVLPRHIGEGTCALGFMACQKFLEESYWSS